MSLGQVRLAATAAVDGDVSPAESTPADHVRSGGVVLRDRRRRVVRGVLRSHGTWSRVVGADLRSDGAWGAVARTDLRGDDVRSRILRDTARVSGVRRDPATATPVAARTPRHVARREAIPATEAAPVPDEVRVAVHAEVRPRTEPPTPTARPPRSSQRTGNRRTCQGCRCRPAGTCTRRRTASRSSRTARCRPTDPGSSGRPTEPATAGRTARGPPEAAPVRSPAAPG